MSGTWCEQIVCFSVHPHAHSVLCHVTLGSYGLQDPERSARSTARPESVCAHIRGIAPPLAPSLVVCSVVLAAEFETSLL